MNNAEAVNWLINITADIGKIEHQDLWHYEQALSEIREMLEDAPTIEPQPIIHCKDCIHIRHWERQECSVNDRVVEDTDFCSWAERRQNEQTD